MFQSKAIKDFPDSKPSSKLYLWWIETPVADKYYEIVRKYITNPIFQVKRLYQWYVNVFHNDFDFDFHCVFAILEYKLKRIKACLDNGYAIQEPKDLKALNLAIKLAGRLKEDNYDSVASDRIVAKWGEWRFWTTPYGDKGCSQMHSTYANIKTPEDEEECLADRRASYIATDKKTKREERNLYAIMHKYGRSWWD
jgi:hypothetical protein